MAIALLNSNLINFYFTLTTMIALNSTTIPTGLINSLNDAFYNYFSVYSVAMEESKKLKPREGAEYVYEHVIMVWLEGLFGAFLESHKAHDWVIMELILEQVVVRHLTRRTLLGRTSVNLSEQELNDAVGCSDAILEENKAKLQEQFILARKLFENKQ